MNQDAHAAYNVHQKNEDESVRETEARALLSCAARLEQARQEDCDRKFFTEALRKNQQLWTVFQASLCDSESPLPKDLRVLLLNISCYVDKTTLRAMGTHNKDLLRGLININRTLAAGLRKNVEENKDTQQPSPTNIPMMPPENAASGSIMTSV